MRDEVSEGICDCVEVDVSISDEQYQVRCSLAPPNEAMVPDDLSTNSIKFKASEPKGI
jgi:hypothetical protein